MHRGDISKLHKPYRTIDSFWAIFTQFIQGELRARKVYSWGRLGILMCASNVINSIWNAVAEFEFLFHLRMVASSIQHNNPFTQYIIVPIFEVSPQLCRRPYILQHRRKLPRCLHNHPYRFRTVPGSQLHVQFRIVIPVVKYSLLASTRTTSPGKLNDLHS